MSKTQQQIRKLHNDWSCVAAQRLIVALAWAASEGRIDSSSEGTKSIIEQLDRNVSEDSGSCTHCQVPSAKERLDSYLQNPKSWKEIAQYMYGFGIQRR